MFLEAGEGLRLPCFEDRPGRDSMDTVGWAQPCLRDGPNSLEGLIAELVWEERSLRCIASGDGRLGERGPGEGREVGNISTGPKEDRDALQGLVLL